MDIQVKYHIFAIESMWEPLPSSTHNKILDIDSAPAENSGSRVRMNLISIPWNADMVDMSVVLLRPWIIHVITSRD